MAITIQQQPVPLQPAFNEAVFIVSSNNVAQDNFKFVCDIYVGGVKVDRLIVPPHPTHLTAFFNVAKVLEGRISKDIAITDDRVMENANSYIAYTCKFGEAYGTTGTTVYPDLTVAAAKYLWNGILDYPDQCAFSSGDYISTGASSQFLTNKPSSGDIFNDDYAWLYFNDFNLIAYQIKYRLYPSPNFLGSTYTLSNAAPTKRFLRVPAGIMNINAMHAGQWVGSPAVFTYSDSFPNSYYSIHLTNLAGAQISEEYFFKIANNCSQYEKRTFVFLNKLGGYDTFSFTLVSKDSIEIERSNYKKNLGSYSGANAFNYAISDRAVSQFNTKVKDKFTVKSDWISEAQMIWLEELLTSPDVLLFDNTNDPSLIPVNITTSSFEKKKVVNEKLFTLSLDYTLSYERGRQRL